MIQVSELDTDGNTPLFLACYKGYRGTDPDEEWTKKERWKIVNLLCEEGSDANFQTKAHRMTPLHWAAFHGDAKVVKLLLDNIKIMDKKGEKGCLINKQGLLPVEIAGMVGSRASESDKPKYAEVVEEFCKYEI